MLDSAMCLPPLDSSLSKTYKRALKFEVALCFPRKIRKTEKSYAILDRAMSKLRHHFK